MVRIMEIQFQSNPNHAPETTPQNLVTYVVKFDYSYQAKHRIAFLPYVMTTVGCRRLSIAK